MAMPKEEVLQMIQDAMPDAEVTLQDLVGDSNHYAVKIISTEFKGKTRIQQHQMVYAALGTKMGAELHALSIRTAVPD